ncbi:ABC transporter ATP-binding protein [Dyella sp. 2RAB6]|uniref:ABC transporter ATP-binding protein n=1 Tax=Dyella sp. 2RAB6 TaxID=3232992 RepID=UPI003F91E772
MHDPGRDGGGREDGPAGPGEARSNDEELRGQPSGAADAADPGILDDIGRAGRAARHLFGAQLSLLIAELGLARSAISWILVAGLAATVAGVGLGLTVMALIGVLLASWLHSWPWALAVLGVLQLLFLGGMIMLFRRCMHWLTLPDSRNAWRETIRQAMRRSEREAPAEPAAKREEGI